MNFTNVSKERNDLLSVECSKAISNKSHNLGIISALLDAVAEIDPIANSERPNLGASRTVETRAMPTCKFLENSQKTTAGFTKEDMAMYPPFGSILEGSDPSTLFVLQSEYGVAVPPLPKENGKGNMQAYIASPDATSCLIVGARAYLVGAPPEVSATAMGHFDCDGPNLIAGMKGMYFKSLLPCLGDQIREWGGALNNSSGVSVQWYFVGGMINKKHTLPCMSDLFSYFFLSLFAAESLTVQALLIAKHANSETKVEVQHSLQPDGQCFWSLNTYADQKGRSTCTIRGLRINIYNGASEPFEMKVGCRNGPFGRCRGARFISQPLFADSVLPLLVRPCDGATQCRSTQDEPQPTAASKNTNSVITVDFSKYLKSVRDAIATGATIPIVVHPANLDVVNKGYARVTEREAAAMSTTPHCEPVDFAARLAANVQYAAKASTACVYGEPALPITNLMV